MNINGRFTIDAPVEQVWDVFMDAEKLASCVPGAERITMTSPNKYEADMVVKVQFMTLKFAAEGELKEAVPMSSLQVEMTGQAHALAGLFRNRMQVTLEPMSDHVTSIIYQMDMQLTGRLASLGMILVKGTVTKTAEQFATNVKLLFETGRNDGGHAAG
ncbi:CoxG family protein [Paenibacillus mendelii]|uniref:CoxG family protein n=1 Tax=Paenibacillus mendelii TaxID=206163 RepID=A0ABV6J9H6_9BACL|nr:carbon monoxide dehydrogenase subunit G [Paenibacillus mendelii]MCQ6559866.1 carbon monoxide dehydrogenase subunit G [Paenibacillus mendelii]